VVDNVNPSVPGVLVGKVTDVNDQPLSGTSVLLTSGSLGATTNTSGQYCFTNLDQGAGYAVGVSKPGYAPATSQNIGIESGTIFKLPPIRLTATVTPWWDGFDQQHKAGRGYSHGEYTFTVVPDCGAVTVAYQCKWDDGTDHPPTNGPTTQDWPLTNLTIANIGTYWCVVTYNGTPHESDHATLDIVDHLVIARAPPSTERSRRASPSRSTWRRLADSRHCRTYGVRIAFQ